MAPLAESSCTVTATGKLDVITVPVAWSEASDPEARPEYVEPATGKEMSKGMPAGCPMRSWVGVMVTTVLSSVATMSNPEVVLNPLFVNFEGQVNDVPKALSPSVQNVGLLTWLTS